MIYYLILICVALIILHLLLNYNKKAIMLRKIPGFKDIFLIGNILDICLPPVQLFSSIRRIAREKNGIYRFWCFPIASVNIYNPEDVEVILSSMKYHEKSQAYIFLKPWLHDGLLLSSGTKWQKRRKILTPAFHFNILRRYHASIAENTIRLVATLRKAVDTRVDIVPVMSDCTLNIICAVEGRDDDEYTMMYAKKKRTAMLDLLILAEQEGLIDPIGIEEEVDTFMFEGHDTTAAGLTYCLMLLANHPYIQDKIFTELREIFGNTKRTASVEDLNAMHYLDRCIKESFRLYPPVPFISRWMNESVTLSNYTVPAGTSCHIHIYDLHRSELLYPSPTVFDPDRFLPENVAKRHHYAYIPFSAGPRNCIGQKFAMMVMKSVVSGIIRNFELHPVTTCSDLRFQADLVLRNSEPVYIKFSKREIAI
ncbi:PREDICTED: cytochrome P450 4C1-like isoform X2 [Papilio xuthus]|uniref:Cytochrome P450 4C1-like isoform X2 n=1 Tax=Papilio xuthus TaxID=66420 RepID=A0AAJ6ZPP9_PAPXU|nr:PREDICTED: cytochrome P450 4C1-like isoform X2 [Papilio xuthus]